ncbi:transglutaminase domain-containing protein [Candidatus Leptofilum sp.]|uniref:transglutaminase family protein n=1 Tax=Candidatus Leptofilum sp. TaxID=3241576 RepID=UPI003B5C0FE0
MKQLTFKTYEPQESWLTLVLLTAVLFCQVAAVLDVGWVPEDGIVVSATIGGLLLGGVLAKRPLGTLPAWALITLYGLLIPLMGLANLWPTWAALRGGWGSLRPYWLQNGALFLDRVAGWGTAVFNNQSSQETVVFALGLALLSYFLTAFACWQLFRHRRPFTGLQAIGLGLALNGYFGGADIWWLALFVGLTAILTAVIHFITLSEGWEAHQVDYSDEVQIDLFIYATAIATILLGLAVFIPNFSIQRLVDFFQQQTAVQQTEAALERAFGGVAASGGQPRGQDGVGGSGILPRDFLLGDAPELYETVTMTAVVQSEANLAGIHWRALSYDVYTGRGWALSEERIEPIAANTSIPLPQVAATATVSQTVYWLQDTRLARYTLGLPQQFSQDVAVRWRGQTDLARVNGRGQIYTASSQFSLASPTMLRQTAVADVPPALLARYTALPEDVPQRVLDLAQEVAGGQTNPYDQARALEEFLRQYPYSLEVSSPPANADPVEHFLFEEQAGYCDFYASAMVVMARAVGLPARMAIGYLAQLPAASVQTIYQINGHSWVEVYFAEFGWVEFEPTAAFTSPHSNRSNLAQPPDFGEPGALPFEESVNLNLPPIPEAEKARPFPWLPLLGAGLLLALVWRGWRQSRLPTGADAVLWSYGRLQQAAAKLGYSPQPQQTPAEFLDAFQEHLAGYGRSPRIAKQITSVQPHVARLTQLYVQRCYAGDAQSGRLLAWESWQRVKRPLWLLRIIRWFVKI